MRISSCLRPDVLTTKIMHALATGNWAGGRSGVSQLLDRTTYLSALSPWGVTSPLVRSRIISRHETSSYSMGRLCTNETPRSELWISQKWRSDDVSKSKRKRCQGASRSRLTIILTVGRMALGPVNGDIFGLHKRPHKLIDQFKRRRRSGRIRPEVSINMMLKIGMCTLTPIEVECSALC